MLGQGPCCRCCKQVSIHREAFQVSNIVLVCTTSDVAISKSVPTIFLTVSKAEFSQVELTTAFHPSDLGTL